MVVLASTSAVPVCTSVPPPVTLTGFDQVVEPASSSVSPTAVTSTVALLVTSIGQLIQQGPRNLIEIGTQVLKVNKDLKIPESKENLDGLNYICENKYSLNDINQMALEGPFAAHYADGAPNMTILLPEITPDYLGQYHYMLEKATAISGYLMEHNPFIQPGVQFWKDKLFTMAGKPDYEEAHQKYLAEKDKKKSKII